MRDGPAAAASDLLPFASDEGLARLVRSDAKVNFPALANQFEAEYNGTFCGPASAASWLPSGTPAFSPLSL